MPALSMKEVRELDQEKLSKKLLELRAELSKERSHVSAGGRPEKPMNIRSLRKGIARILTHSNSQGYSQEAMTALDSTKTPAKESKK